MRPAARSLRAAPLPCRSVNAFSHVLNDVSRAPGSHLPGDQTNERAHALLVVDAPDRFARAAARSIRRGASRSPSRLGRSGIVSVTTSSSSGDSLMRLIAGPESTGCVIAAETPVAPSSHQRARRLGQRARRVDDVVDDDAGAALHVADDVHHLGDVGAFAPLVDDGERRVQALGVGARALDAAGVGRDDRERLRRSACGSPRAAPASRTGCPPGC